MLSLALTRLGELPSIALNQSAAGDQSNSFVVYGSALAVAVAMVWALLERQERKALLSLNRDLSDSCQKLIDQHYRERLSAEERHLMSHDSSVRNVLESLERALLGKPKP